jgi:hypothetical protein
MESALQQVIYTSIASPLLDGGEIFKIVSDAAQKNRRLEITGMLVIVQGRFFQAIEGPPQNIDKLLNSLNNDPRHHSVRVLRRNSIELRQFPNWSMRRFRIDDARTARRVFRELLNRTDDAARILRKFEAYVESSAELAA